MATLLMKLIQQTCIEESISIEDLSKHMIYMAHETSTPRCAFSEIYALRTVFGPFLSNIILCALKGLCGHSMGTNYEEVIMIDVLKQKCLPPVIYLENPDLKLGTDLCFSKGETHTRKYGLRFAAGFGSSLGYTLYCLV
jgi:3-oxoacyl-(acyl-carrier-protein) synthase